MKLFALVTLIIMMINSGHASQNDNDGCISLQTAKDILEANLIAEGRYIDQSGEFNPMMIERLDWDDTLGYSAQDFQSFCGATAAVSCLGKYSFSTWCEE